MSAPTPSWSRVRTVFEAAFDLPQGERAALLEAECGGDEALRAEVEELLASESAAASLLEPLIGDQALVRQLAAPGLSETVVGGYRLVRLLGCGGMGVVFEAEQDQPRRRVALKMLRLGFSVEDAARFRFEAELLGRLRHPGIAQVHAAGLHEVAGGAADLPWFAMEFIDGGKTLLEHAAAAELSVNERVALLAEVCDALQHAHQHGVLHCDLKPANVLVDAGGQPKVIDFGVGRARDGDAARQTVTRQIMGTLAYMSPEQVTGERAIDARSDVYALGAILFELLAGKPPRDFATMSLTEAVRQVQHVPVPPLSEARHARPDDLDVIVAKAMAAEREQRYASAAQLGEDLRRWLRSEPVTARPPSALYQARLFARRNRALVTAAAIAVLSLVVATAIALRSANVANEALDEAARERDRAKELFGALLDSSTTQVFDFHTRLLKVEGAVELRRDMLLASLDNLALLEQRAEGDAAVHVLLARAYVRLANVQGNPTLPNLGEREAAARAVDRAMTLAEAALTADPRDADARLALAEVTLARAGLASGFDPAACQRDFARALELYDELAGDDPLLHDLPRGRCYVNLMREALMAGHSDEALAFARARHRLSQLAAQDAPDDTVRQGNHATASGALGMVLSNREDYAEAERIYRDALGTLDRLRRAEPDDERHERFYWQTRAFLGLTLLDAGRWADAETELLASCAYLRDRIAEEPEVWNRHVQLAVNLTACGRLYHRWAADDADNSQRQARLESARASLAEALARFRELEDAGRLPPEHGAVVRQGRTSFEAVRRELGER